MKRIAKTLLLFVLLLSLTACNTSNNSSNVAIDSNPTTEYDDFQSEIITPPPVTSSDGTSSLPSDSVSSNESSTLSSETPSSSDNVSDSSENESNSSVVTPEIDINLFRKSFNLGHNKSLIGKPVVMLFYIDDDKSAWDEASVIDFTENQVKPALDYLKETATNQNVKLDFELVIHSTPHTGNVYKYEGVVENNLKVNPSTKDVLDKVAEDLGYASNWEMHKSFEALYPDREIIYLTFFNKKGVSYTRHQITSGFMEYAEHSVIFVDYLTAPENSRDIGTRSSVIAHELLHLFGAEDFYTTTAREKLADELYPTDIMLWQFENISENSIGAFTAFSIGWTDTVPNICHNDNWWK